MKPSILRLLALVTMAFASAAFAEVVPHPVPWEFASTRYEVSVNGKPVNVFFAAMNVHFASFDFTGTVDVQVTINNNDYSRMDGRVLPTADEFWQGAATVRPTSRGIVAKTEGKVVRFSIAQPGQFSVERPGTKGFEDEVLFLFANPPESKVPSKTDPNVIWIEPGLHQRSVDLSSGQTLYLESGAVLFGAVNVWDAKDVRICGRGTLVYDGPNSRNFDSGWMNRKNWRPLTTHAVEGLTVDGIHVVNRARTWSIQLWKTTRSLFTNLKVIATCPENLNADGIDWYDGGDAVVRDSFFRTADDCFAFYTAESSDVFRGDRGGGGHLRGLKAEAPVTRGEVKNILVERCVLWPTVANVIRAGYVNQALTTRNVTLRDCDVIHMGQPAKPWLGANWGLLSAVSTTGGAESVHEDYTFDGIRVEAPSTLFGVNWPQAQLRRFRFNKLDFTAGTAPSYLRASVDGLTFENVRINGRAATSTQDLDLTLEGGSKDIRFGAHP